MITQILVYKQRVQSRSIKTGKEHTDHNEQVNLLVFYSFGQIAIIVLELFTIHSEVRFKHHVVIANRFCQKLFGAAVHCRRVKIFIFDIALSALFFIRGERKYGGNFQGPVTFFLQIVQFLIIQFGSLNAVYCEHGIKALVIPLRSMGFYPEILQDVLRNPFDPVWMKQKLLIFCRIQLDFIFFSFQILKPWTNIVIVHFELQNLFITYGVCDDIRMQLTAEHTGRSLRPQSILRKDRGTRKAKLVISLEPLFQILLRFSELGTVALIENKYNLFLINGQVAFALHEVVQLLNGRNDNLVVILLYVPLQSRRAL